MEVLLDPAREADVRSALAAHFTKLRYFDVETAVTQSLSVEGRTERFDYLKRVLPASAFGAGRAVLVSGMAAGSELVAARAAGFGDVHGIEVDPAYVELCRLRLGDLPGFHLDLYDGGVLPYPDAAFDLVCSEHVVEHTADPALYLAEHLRVLKPGGHLFLEYPTRFHHHELHTGLWSLEWLPERVRGRLLRALGSERSPLAEESRRKCRVILETGLKQVSLPRIERWIARSGARVARVATARNAPGHVRVVFRLE